MSKNSTSSGSGNTFSIWVIICVIVAGIIIAAIILSKEDPSDHVVGTIVTTVTTSQNSPAQDNIIGDIPDVEKEIFSVLNSSDLPHNLIFSSSGFQENQRLSLIYTCYRNNYSPALEWSNAPKGTQSFAIFLTRDNEEQAFVNWALFNIGADKTKLNKNIDKTADLQDGSAQAITDHNNVGYIGPCEPLGKYEYTFRLFALDTMLDLKGGVGKDDVLRSMSGHVLDAYELKVEHYYRF